MIINYQALKKYESPEQAARWRKIHSMRKRTSGWRILLLVVMFIVLAPIAAIILAILGAIFPPIPVVVIIGGFALIIWYSMRYNRNLHAAAQQFAADNGWQFSKDAPDMDITSANPPATSYVKTDGPAINGSLNGWQFWLYRYTAVISQGGDSAGSAYSYFTLSAKLPAALPPFMLDATVDGKSFQQVPAGLERISLEGNFDQHFRLYQPIGTQVDVLSIITPEFMQALIESAYFVNIIVDEQYVHFLSSYGSFLSATTTEFFFSQVQEILDGFSQKLNLQQNLAQQQTGTNRE